MKIKSMIFVFAVAVLIGGYSVVPAQNRQVLAQAERITGDQFTYAARTPRGAMVYSVNRPRAAMLAAIDRGLADLFAVARRNGYARKTNFADYTIYIARADRVRDSSGRYSPDIAVGAAQYAGTDYDQGGFIYAAGMVVAFNPCTFVIAEHTADLQRVADVVRYEGEHLILYHNDRNRYSQTADHSRGGGHPILQ
jgi:hypothetical protein